jgi:hypothetical protein
MCFQAVEAGETTLELVYRRPWERVEPAATFSVRVKSIGTFERVPPPPTPTLAPALASAPEPAVEDYPGPDNANFPTDLPSSYNWCDQNGCTPVKDQGSCGSCWAFATSGVVESNIRIHDGVIRDLAEQYLVSCNTDGWGCDGGGRAFDYFLDEIPPGEPDAGAVYEADFPYTAADDPCNPPHPHHEKIVSWAYAGYSGPPVDDIKQAIYDHGPVYVSVCVGPAFQDYGSGVFETDESSSCEHGTNHAVILVGWDDSQGSNGVWRLKNSWDTSWGESGYMRIGYGISNVGRYPAYVVYGGVDAGPLVYNNHTIDDDTDGQSNGNGDGVVNCGESIELFVTLYNQGSDTATGVNATISTSDPYVTWLYDTASDYPDISGGGTGVNSNDFDLSVDASAPNGHTISFDLNVTASNGGPWSDTFDVPVVCSASTYDVGGYVRDTSGTGISGVSADFGGARPAVTTDGSGYYTQSDFSAGDYTVRFGRSGYTFSPVVDRVTVSGTHVIHDATGYPFTPTSIPFSDGFEGGNLGGAWAVETDYEGRLRVGSDHPHAGSYSLLLDDESGSDGDFYSHASAILTLDLSGQSQVELGFWWGEFSDENHTDDGLFISDDYGDTWYQAFSFNDGVYTYTQATIDLDAQTNAAGMSYNDHFLIKFQFYDNYPVDSDGYAIDDVTVTAGAASCNDPHEPNDTVGQATPIGCGDTLTSLDICPAGDVDYYAFSGHGGDTIVASVDAQVIGSSLDSYLVLYDTGGATELTHNNDANGTDSRLSYILPADGTYYLLVREYSHPNEGGADYFYTLSLAQKPSFNVNAGWTSIPPAIDGQISPGEWDDATVYDITTLAVRSLGQTTATHVSETTLPESWPGERSGEKEALHRSPSAPDAPQATVTLYAMNDGQRLYLAINDPNDTTADTHDQMGVYFDDEPLPSDGRWTNTTCGNPSGEGNFWVLTSTVKYREWISGPVTCDVVVPAPGVAGVIDHISGHTQAEVAIDLTSSALQAIPGDAINTYLWIHDRSAESFAGQWPITAVYYDPATYRRLTLATGYAPPAPNLLFPSNGSSTEGTLTFSWSPVHGATSYRIQVDDGPGFSSPEPEIDVTTTDTNYTPSTHLSPGDYYWRVRGVNTSGEGNWSSTWSLTITDFKVYLPAILRHYPPNQSPDTPSHPTPADDATDQSTDVNLSWSGGDYDGDAVTYDVYFEAGDCTPDVLVSDDQSNASYDPGTLSGNTHYYWQIVATDTRGAAAAGPVWHFGTQENSCALNPQEQQIADFMVQAPEQQRPSLTCHPILAHCRRLHDGRVRLAGMDEFVGPSRAPAGSTFVLCRADRIWHRLCLRSQQSLSPLLGSDYGETRAVTSPRVTTA